MHRQQDWPWRQGGWRGCEEHSGSAP